MEKEKKKGIQSAWKLKFVRKDFTCPDSSLVEVWLQKATAISDALLLLWSLCAVWVKAKGNREHSCTTDGISHPPCPPGALSDRCHAATLGAHTVWQNSLAGSGWHKEVCNAAIHWSDSRPMRFLRRFPFKELDLSPEWSLQVGGKKTKNSTCEQLSLSLVVWIAVNESLVQEMKLT